MAKGAKKNAKTKKATKSASANEAKAFNAGPLSEDEVEALRKSFHRVLRNKRVAQPQAAVPPAAWRDGGGPA